MAQTSRGPALTRRTALALATAAAASTGARAADPSTIRVSFPVPVATLDPHKCRVGGLEYNYILAVFSHLTKQDDKLQVIPDLATSWESSPDLKSWTFHLRQGVTWHDGKPFTAADVVFSVKRLQDKDTASVLRANFEVVTAATAVDPLTVRFDMSIPYADLPAVVAGYQAAIVSEANVAALTTKPIGTGPFRFVEYRPGDQFTFEKNPAYFVPGLPKVDRAIFRIIPEASTAVAGLESGALDIVYDLPPEQVDRLKRSTASTVMEVATGTWQGIIMHNGMKPFDDKRVRQAFIKMVDKPAVTDIATFGHGTPTVTPLPPTHPYFDKAISVAADIPGAKKLLADAGYASGLTVEMYIPSADAPLERLATAFRDAAKQAGVTVTLRIAPQDKFFAEMEGKVPLNVDNFFGRTTPDLQLYPWYHSTGSWNNTLWHYRNDEVDQLLTDARSTTDTAKQKALYTRFQEIIAEDGPGCVVYVKNFACGVSKKVSGFTPSPLQLVDVSSASVA